MQPETPATGKTGGPFSEPQRIATPTKLALVILPILAALGPYASLELSTGSSFYLYRFLCIVLLVPVVIATASWFSEAPPGPRTYVLFAISWCLWAPMTLLWNMEGSSGTREVISISVALFGGVGVVALSRGTIVGDRAIRRGWVGAFVATALVAVWELASGRHLESNRHLLESGTEYVTSTFYNQNNYAGFLLACLPFLALGIAEANSRLMRILHGALLFAWIPLAVSTQSRTAVVCGLAAVPILTYWLVRTARIRIRKILLPSVLTGFAVIVALFGVANSAPGRRTLADFSSPFLRGSSGTGMGDLSRLSLTRLGWDYFIDSGLLGRGPRTFESLARGDSAFGQLEGATNPHNSLIELAAKYGIAPTAPLLALLVIVIYSAVATSPRGKGDIRVLNLRAAIMLGMTALIASSLVASSTLQLPWWWILLGTLVTQTWRLDRIRRDSDAIHGTSVSSNRHGVSAKIGNYPR